MGGSAGGLRLIFDPALDGGGWPGVLGDRDAAVGEQWLGPRGLLARLETELGLGGPWPSETERACALAALLRDRAGFWRRSFDADPLATARRLLSDRDALFLWGWRGQPAGERLADLWAATAGAEPGLPDRLAAATQALGDGDADIDSIELGCPLAALEPGWQDAFAALAGRGVHIRERPTPTAPPPECQVQLVRPHGPLAAADELAAALAAHGDLRGVVVIGADAVLDAALHRHGLPCTGGGDQVPASAALVRLVLEAAFRPMDPQDLHALLCLDPGPVPRVVARELAGALGSLPGRGSPLWQGALATGLERIDESRRAAVAERLAILLGPAAARDELLPVAAIESRLAALSRWARGRADAVPSLAAVTSGATAVLRQIERLGADALGHTELRRVCDDALGDGSLAAPAEAGLASVAHPGAILGPARVVIWWSFTRDRAPRLPRLRLSVAERRALLAAGVTPPDLGALAASEAERWRRPLLHASDAVVLMCPHHDDTGEPAFPHPLWDELATDPRRCETRALTALATPAREPVALRPLPAPEERATCAPLSLREQESPSSLEHLLGCSLSYSLHYHARLRPGLSSGPPQPPAPLLYGNLAHHVMAQIFESGAIDASAAAARAEAILDRDLDDLCESLALPRYQVERATLRQAVIRSAEHLADLIAQAGATVEGVELAASRSVDGLPLGGTADLVLRGPDAVLDLKWGISANRKKLESGTALQLAAYAELFRDVAARPAVGYYILKSQQLLTEPGAPLPEASAPGDCDADAIWQATLAAVRARVAELARGELCAPGNLEEVPKSALTAAGLALEPPCRYCERDSLCGKSGAA